MTATVDVDRIRSLLQAELAAVTGEPAERFGDAMLLGDAGVDSLDLIEALLGVREQVLEDLGLDADEVEDPPPLPWIETVGELVTFVHDSIPARHTTSP